jgi:AcrR family transcriptional regulator
MNDAMRADSPITLTARQRARAEVTGEILRAARGQLASEGAAGISLRAVARDLGMPSSGIYRYFSTREELLTRLIIEAYDSIGAAAEDSQRDLPPGDLLARFAAACRAIRAWALVHPHEYSLVFGSPIPDYQAPEQTVPAAARVPGVLGAILLDAAKRRASPRHQQGIPLTDAGRRAIAPALELFAHRIPAEQAQAGLMVWSGLFGAISFELYGHQYGSVGQAPEDRDAYFESCIAAWAAQAGIS